MSTSNSLEISRSALNKRLLIFGIGLAFVMQVFLVFYFEISWDEFYILSMIYKFAGNEVGNPHQTFLYHFFDWLRIVPGDEIDKIRIARLPLVAVAAATCYFIFKTSKRFFSTNTSLFAVLIFISFYYVFRNIMSLRADGMATMLLMFSLFLTTAPKLNWPKIIGSGILIGAAGMLTYKAIFYIPIIATILIAKWAEDNWSKKGLIDGVAMGAASIISFLLFYWIHTLSITTQEFESGYMSNAMSDSLIPSGLFPRPGPLKTSLLFGPIFWIGIAFGYHTLRNKMSATSSQEKRKALVIFSFLFPLCTVIFYGHANAYYYVFIAAPAAVFIAAAIENYLSGKYAQHFPKFIILTIAMMGLIFGKSMLQPQRHQEQIVDLVHNIFPTSVPHLDFCGMISSYNRVLEPGAFITPYHWKRIAYHENGPKMEQVLRTYKPQFLIANAGGLDLNNEYEHADWFDLHYKDKETLEKNYQKFWGPIFLPGKSFKFEHNDLSATFEIVIDGTYTYSGESNVTIDGKEVSTGDTIILDAGDHRIEGFEGNTARLIWGNNLQHPQYPYRPNYVFKGF